MRWTWKALGWGLVLSAGVAWAGGPGQAAAPPGAPGAKAPAGKQDKAARDAKDALELAAKIDRLVAARWTESKVQPAAPADDAHFLRRVYLDVAGRIPRVSEARAFLADKRPDKRQRLVEQLLAGPGYANHFANVWRDLLVPETNNGFGRSNQAEMEAWLRKQFATNVGYDQFVKELLTFSQERRFTPDSGPTPLAFYNNKEYKPENLGSAVSALFLGVKLECAQCHNHPFAKWKRQEFWEFAAFFAGFDGRGGREFKDRREIGISGGDKVVQASFLDGTEPRWKYDVSSRQILADWVISPGNPFFARAGANRLWGYFFGIGLVDPVDDMRADNPPSHPELLDELASQFAAHQFDLKFMIRAITASRTYQLSSVSSHPSQDDPRLFARMALKALTPAQLFDSLSLATGFREKGDNRRFLGQDDTLRDKFLDQFASQDKRTEFQTSILQALMLMNGKIVEQVTDLKGSAILASVADSPFLDTKAKIETLFLAALSRPPRPEELDRFVAYVEKGGARGDTKTALSDVFWVLLNSPDFLLNR